MTPIVAASRPAVAVRPKRMTAANIRRGRIAVPWFILLYGEAKIGKSSFASGAPSPIWIELDNGTSELDIARYPKPSSFADVLEALEDVAITAETATREGRELPFKTLVVDPLSQLEPLVGNDVTGGVLVNTKTWGGGFNAYENACRDRVRVFFLAVERAWKAGLNVMLIGHSKTKKFEDPEGPAYDRYELDVDSKELAGMAMKVSQAIFFCKREVYGKVDPSTKRAKAAGAGIHMLYTAGTAAYRAGNRWKLPPALPLSWAAFADAMANGQKQTDAMLAEIEAGLTAIGDESVTTAVRGWLTNGQDPAAVRNAVRVKLEELVAAQVSAEPDNEETTTTTTTTNEEETPS